jgi:type II secretory pathway pseudopilin PulG
MFAKVITIDTNNLPDIGYILTHHIFEIAVVVGVVVLGILASFALEIYKNRIQGKKEEALLKKAIAKGLAGISTVFSAAGSYVALAQHGNLALLTYIPAVAAVAPTIASVAYFFYNLGGNKFVKSTINFLSKWSNNSTSTVIPAQTDIVVPTGGVASDPVAPSDPGSMIQ